MTNLIEIADAGWWLECEACAAKSRALYDAVRISDRLVAKGVAISEMAQIARSEVRMRELLLATWNVRADQASKRAESVYISTGSVASAMNAVDAVFAKWDDDVVDRYAREIEEVYTLARTAGVKRASGVIKKPLEYTSTNFTAELEEVSKAAPGPPVLKPSFDVYDSSAVAALHDDQMLWIGSHYERNVRDKLRTHAAEAVKRGKGRREAGRLLRESIERESRTINVPEGFRGSAAKYFEGLAANTATNARVRGQIRSFSDLGVVRYTIVNPMDHRTSRICVHMNGKTFTVPQAVAQIESEAGATVPDDIKKAHPWVSFAELKAISPKAGAAGVGDANALAAAGFALPPYHFRCRTTVDISDERAFEPMTGAEARAVRVYSIPVRPPPPKPSKKPSTSKPIPTPKPTTKPKAIKPEARAATMPPPDPLAPLRTGYPDKFEALGGGVNTSEIATLDNGVKGVWKSAIGEADWITEQVGGALYKREAAAYQVDRILGTNVVPRTVSRKMGLEAGSFQEFVKDATTYRKTATKALESAAKSSGNEMAFLDVVIGNADRHTGNVMVAKSGKAHRFVAIDNGFSMPKKYHPGFLNGRRLHTIDSREAAKMLDFTELVKRSGTIEEMAAALAKEGIEKEAAKQVVGRFAALKSDPKALAKVASKRAYVDATDFQDWMNRAWKYDLSDEDMLAVSRAIGDAFK